MNVYYQLPLLHGRLFLLLDADRGATFLLPNVRGSTFVDCAGEVTACMSRTHITFFTKEDAAEEQHTFGHRFKLDDYPLTKQWLQSLNLWTAEGQVVFG